MNAEQARGIARIVVERRKIPEFIVEAIRKAANDGEFGCTVTYLNEPEYRIRQLLKLNGFETRLLEEREEFKLYIDWS